MTAAIYARKSTEQRHVDEEQKSVTRQIEHARAYAARKGWTVNDAAIFVDDGISGAEFARRPGFVRLMTALQPRPPFQVLIISDESRLGRESIETSYALKQLTRAGVRVFCYLEDRERTLDSPIEKAMLALQAMSDEMERSKAQQRTYDAMRRKAERGEVTGGRCFGYRNVDVTSTDADGRPKRQHVRRELVEEEAAVIRRIFELCAAGEGLKAITKRLNADRTPAPRSQRGRVRAWAPSSVREVLYREAYRGRLVWNKSRKRDADGRKHQVDRPAAEWLQLPGEALRVVSDALWEAAHVRLTERRRHYDRSGAARHASGSGLLVAACGARNAREPRTYLLSGFARCAGCGAAVQAASRQSTTGRLFRYVCGGYVNRGVAVCGNRRMARMDVADDAIRQLLANEVVQPKVLQRALDFAIDILRPERQAADANVRRGAVEKRLTDLQLRLCNLTEVAASGGAVPSVLEALRSTDQQRAAAVDELAALDRQLPPPISFNPRRVRDELREYVSQWRSLTADHVSETRALLALVLRERITFRPFVDGVQPMYELTVPLHFDRLIATVIPAIGAGGDPSGGLRIPLGTPILPDRTSIIIIPAA